MNKSWQESLSLVSIRSGKVQPPQQETGAEASSSLDTPQRAIAIGEPVPIVFGRWRNGIGGGIFISPGATEARFENNSNNDVTAYYHLVISEGEVDGIQVRDVYQRSCRVGTHTQTYGRRAGTWLPGNYIIPRADKQRPDCPVHCGSVGAYPGMTTLSFYVTIPDGFDQWNRQVHIFVRGGMHVTRLYDSTVGPSDNFADLVLWMLSNNGRVPSALIDTAALGAAAAFLEVNRFTCNCWLTESQNYADLLAEWAPMFLLCESSNEGKRGLRPLLPVNANGTINTGAIDWEYIFTEDTILPGTFEIEYSSLSDRLPFVVQIIWRQELGYDAAIIRTAEVRYAGTAESGPYESHDLSAFCTQEDHAVKVGTYILARRTHSTHTIRFSARPQSHNRSLTVGDIVRVKLARTATAAAPSHHDYLYQIERITKTLAGDVSYECSHFPIDEQGRSIIAVEVDAAQGDGVLLSGNRTGVTCDDGDRWDDITVPPELWFDDPDDPGLGDWPEYPWPTDPGGDPLPWPTDPGGDPLPWPTDPGGDPLPWPTDPGGDPIPFDPDNPDFDPWNDGGDPTIPLDPGGLPTVPLDPGGLPTIPLDPGGLPVDGGPYFPWPTDPGGNPIPFDPDNPDFDPWNDGGDPTVPLDPGGLPTVPLDPGGLPVDNGPSPTLNGGGIIQLPSDGSGGGGESPGDGPGDGPDDDSENPDDDKDPSPDDPYSDWPPELPRPGEPGWPPDLPISTEPGDPNGWVEIGAPIESPPDEGASITRFTASAYLVDRWNSDCTLGTPIGGGARSTDIAFVRVIAVIYEYHTGTCPDTFTEVTPLYYTKEYGFVGIFGIAGPIMSWINPQVVTVTYL